jgi:hypothetical protein
LSKDVEELKDESHSFQVSTGTKKEVCLALGGTGRKLVWLQYDRRQEKEERAVRHRGPDHAG